MVVLYNPRSSAGRKPILPLALLSVGAALGERYRYAVVDGNVEDDPLARVDALLTQAEARLRAGETRMPPVLGITAMPGPQLLDGVPLATEIKKRHPSAVLVWGGYFATQHWETCLRSRCVDFVVRGHGEHVFRQLLDALAEGPTPERLRAIPGLAWRDLSGRVANPMPAVPDPPPTLPLEAVDVARYVRPTVLGRRTLGWHSSYGCPFPCNFCAVVSMVEGKWKAQPAEAVADVFRAYKERWDVDAVELYDNNFFVSEKRCRAFADLVRPLGMKWWGEGRIDTLLRFSDDTWHAMADSGLAMVFLGAESGSAETLKRMDKGGTLVPEMTLALVERMAKFGVVPELSFVLGSPPDPDGDIEGTLGFVKQVKRRNPATEIILYLYTPEPVDGALYDGAQAAGFAWPRTLEEWADPAWEDVVQRRSEKLPWMPADARRRLKDFERVLNARYPTTTDRNLRRPVRWMLKGMAAWRWRAGVYRWPYELAAMQKLVRYQRPETSGF